MAKKSTSAVVVVKNEEKNIRRCLESIRWVDEIVLIDSHSIDDTLKIAKKYNPKIYQFNKKKYLLREKINFGIKKANKDWILIIDADEEVTPKLKKEINKKIGSTKYNAFNVCFNNYSFGRLLKGSFWKDMPITRIFRRSKGIYKDIEPHKLLSIEGEVGTLKESIIHYTYTNTREFLAKTDKYTSLSAPLIVKNNKGGILNKKTIKTNIYTCYIEPVIFSGWIFLRKKMYKDHFIGLWLSLLMGYYLYLEQKKVKRIKKVKGAKK